MSWVWGSELVPEPCPAVLGNFSVIITGTLEHNSPCGIIQCNVMIDGVLPSKPRILRILSGELSVAICFKTLCFTGHMPSNCSENFRECAEYCGKERWANLVQVGQRCFSKQAKDSKTTTNLAKLVQVGLLGTNLVQVGPVHLVPPYLGAREKGDSKWEKPVAAKICGFLRFPAKICGFLRFSAQICDSQIP